MSNKRNLIGLAILGVVGFAAYAAKASASVLDSQDDTGSDSANILNNLETTIGDLMTNWKTGEYSKYASAIRESEKVNGIPTDLLARLLYQESHYRADIIEGRERSPVGAVGIAQFMPATGKQYGLTDAQGNDLRTDPYASIAAAGRYLRALRNMFGEWESAIMAYNWGPGNVTKFNRGEAINVPIETSEYLAQITADVPIA